jgi:hypothetical protein
LLPEMNPEMQEVLRHLRSAGGPHARLDCPRSRAVSRSRFKLLPLPIHPSEF